MAKFEIAYAITNKYEKGYDTDPDDNGNWTGGKKGVGVLAGTIDGITAPEVMSWLGHTPTPDEVKNFPESARKAIYKRNYWDHVRGDEIANQEMANNIYDEAVNAGEFKAIKEAQALAGIPQTGKMDDSTLKQINSVA